MPPRLFRSLLIAIALGAVVALILAVTASLPATLTTLAGFRWRLGPAILVSVLASWALRFAKWHYYLRRLQIPVAWWPSLRVFLAGFTMAISPGKVGEVLKAVLVKGLAGTPTSRTASAVLAERLTDVAGLLILGGFGLMALPRGPLLLGGLAVGLILAVVTLRAPVVSSAARRVLPDRLVEPARTFVHSGRALLGTGALAVAVALSVVAWFLECLAFALVLNGLGVFLPLRATTFAYAFSALAGAVSMLPGGLGVAEGSLTGLLAGLGTPLPEAAAATLLVRAVTLWFAVALGVVVLAAIPANGAGERQAAT